MDLERIIAVCSPADQGVWGDLVLISEQRRKESVKLRIIVGISGASGSIYGWRLLEKLRQNPNVEIHLILTRAGERTAHIEIGKSAAEFREKAHFWYPVEDIGARVASGSAQIDAMIIAPC